MGYSILEQPNKLWCIFSSYSDEFIMIDAEKQDLINWFLELERERTTKHITRVIEGKSHQWNTMEKAIESDYHRTICESNIEMNDDYEFPTLSEEESKEHWKKIRESFNE